MRILVTGASGYIGGRLVPRLLALGHEVRAMVRDPAQSAQRLPREVELCRGDALNPEEVAQAVSGCAVVYYLIHSMGAARDFVERDRRAAQNFARACSEKGVQKLIYLGGLGDQQGDELSPHLQSRREVEGILGSSTATLLAFRASIVIGAGSLSFELVRALTERLPVMLTPQWVRVQAQPIAIEDVLAYLVEAASLACEESQCFEIGGPDRVSYGDLIQEYAAQRGLRRCLVKIPLLTPWLSSLWLGLVTPLYTRIGRQLIESLKNPTIVLDDTAERVFAVRPVGVKQAMSVAIHEDSEHMMATKWSDAVSSLQGDAHKTMQFGTMLFDTYTTHVATDTATAFVPIQRIGGKNGWYFANLLWRLRGWLDLLFGGIGLRRGRLHPKHLRVGDTLDWWRVEAHDPPHKLKLLAEMRVPGKAWLDLEVREAPGGSQIIVCAQFAPLGLWGLMYWYILQPVHWVVFRGLLRALRSRALQHQAELNTLR